MNKSIVLKFIRKTLFFVLPFLMLYFINFLFLKKDKGDLINVGYIYSFFDFKVFEEEDERYYKTIHDYDNSNKVYDVVNVGDSFSQQENLGYLNFLGKKDINILNIENNPKNNPLEVLLKLFNGGFFNKIKTKYVILESIERSFVRRCQKLNFTDSLTISELEAGYSKYVENKRNAELLFFSREIFQAPRINISYFLGKDNPKGAFMYRVDVKKELFENKNKLLFYKEDYTSVYYNNDDEYLKKANVNLNTLAKQFKSKGIQLIVLVCPDKYDLYYDYISNNERYKKPMFFDKFKKLQRDYILVRSKEKLTEEIKREKDVYHYYDTHWTPIASSSIADELAKLIKFKK